MKLEFDSMADFLKAATEVKDVVNPPKPENFYTRDEVRMIVNGAKIDAIKCVRARTGWTLADAKDHVDWLATAFVRTTDD